MKVSTQNPYLAVYANEGKEAEKSGAAVSQSAENKEKPSVKKLAHAETNELYNAEGKVSQKSEVEQQKEARNASHLEMIMKEIWEQTYALLQEVTEKLGSLDKFEKGMLEAAAFTGDVNDPLKLGAFFAENPDALEKVKNGEIPDYFNVENTGDRILDIWLSDYDVETSVEEFVELVRNYINKAYSQVSGMFSGLPQLVQDTKEYVMRELDAFAQKQAETG